MRKIEVYDNFNLDLGFLLFDDLLVLAVRDSVKEALRLGDWDTVSKRFIVSSCPEWLIDTVTRERQGEKVLPYYVWAAASNHLQKIADTIVDEAHKQRKNKQNSKEERQTNEKFKKLLDKMHDPSTGVIEYDLLYADFERLTRKCDAFKTPDLSRCLALGFNLLYFKFEYFGPDLPDYSPSELISASNDLASKLISYAQQLRQADL